MKYVGGHGPADRDRRVFTWRMQPCCITSTAPAASAATSAAAPAAAIACRCSWSSTRHRPAHRPYPTGRRRPRAPRREGVRDRAAPATLAHGRPDNSSSASLPARVRVECFASMMPANAVTIRRKTRIPIGWCRSAPSTALIVPNASSSATKGRTADTKRHHLIVGRAIAKSLQARLHACDQRLHRRLELLSRHVGLDRQKGWSIHERRQRRLVGHGNLVTQGIDAGAVPRRQAEQDRIAEPARTPGEISQFQRAQGMRHPRRRPDLRAKDEALQEDDDSGAYVESQEGAGSPVERIPGHRLIHLRERRWIQAAGFGKTSQRLRSVTR